MKNLIIVGIIIVGSLEIVSCRTTPDSGTDTKSVEDIGSVTSVANGLIVVCKDGNTMRYSPDEFRTHVADNSICGGSGSESDWMCAASNSFSSKITRISDGKSFGEDAANDTCQNAIRSTHLGMICIPANSFSSSVMLPGSKSPIGQSIGHKDCIELINAANAGVVCVPENSFSSVITRMSDGRKFGNAASNDDCKKLAAGVRSGIVCAADNSFSATLTRISDGKTIGTSVNFDQCINSIPAR